MKRFWPSWRSFKTNWLNDAAKRAAKETAKEQAEKIRLKLAAPPIRQEQTAKGPVVAVIAPELPIQRPTRAEVLENFPHARGPRY